MVKDSGFVINNCRYTDDTIGLIIAESEADMFDIVVDKRENKYLYLNSLKSFTMVFSKTTIIWPCRMTVYEQSLEPVVVVVDQHLHACL